MKFPLFCIFLAGAGLATGMRAAEPAIIAKARSYLGSDAALDGVKSVHMVGSMESSVADKTSTVHTAQVDIVFQKPYEESLTIITAPQLARKVLDGYNGWQLVQALPPGAPPQFDPSRPETLTILGLDQIRILRADTWENLQYYRGLESTGGTTEDMGPVTIEGVACEKVALRHSDAIVYYRYFDVATGRLVFTETYAGAKIHEAGELVEGGVRFPKTITVDEVSGGKAQKTVITIDSVKLNEVFADSFFATPPPPLPVHLPAPASAASAAPAPTSAPAPTTTPPAAATPATPQP